MKKYMNVFNKFCLIFGLAAIIGGCTKNDAPTPVPVTKVAIPKITKKSGDVSINVLEPEKFSASVNVEMLFPDDEKPSKFDIVIVKNGNKSDVKLLKADVTTFPTSVSINGEDIRRLFGVYPVLGDTYDIGADVFMKDGQKWDAFPEYGLGYGAGVINITGSSVTVQYGAICAYDPSIYEGDFEVVVDEWADYSPGDIITLTKVDDTHFSLLFEYALNPKPVTVTVNALDNNVTVSKQVVGSVWDYNNPRYSNPFVSAVGSVKPCDETVTLTVTYGSDAGTWSGTYALVLKKKN